MILSKHILSIKKRPSKAEVHILSFESWDLKVPANFHERSQILLLFNVVLQQVENTHVTNWKIVIEQFHFSCFDSCREVLKMDFNLKV